MFGLRHRLVLAREVAGLEQAELAVSLGVTRQTVSNYERATTKPQRAVLLAWALATGVDSDWLITGRDTPSPDDGGAGMHVTDRYPKAIRARAVATRLTRVA